VPVKIDTTRKKKDKPYEKHAIASMIVNVVWTDFMYISGKRCEHLSNTQKESENFHSRPKCFHNGIILIVIGFQNLCDKDTIFFDDYEKKIFLCSKKIKVKL
jgi:uncharacterized membrane protein YkgB